ncbi:MAG: hypothetical protein ABEJ66_02760 [Candidatus Nanohaloarchaea archaeon]
MHSEIFSGRSFAAFPLAVFLLAFTGTWTVLRFSTLMFPAVRDALLFFGFFTGLAVGSIGFSSRDAVKNVLGPTNFLVYSSRTLPVSGRKLLGAFLVKDLVYYTALFLLPVSLGASLASGQLLGPGMAVSFLAGLISAVVMARLSLRAPGRHVSYSGRPSPLTSKTLSDLSRSAGGLFKVFFSMLVLSGLYWTAVSYFPATSGLLRNPVLSFSVLLGLVSLSVYNWVNRFDSVEDYLHLPVNRDELLDSKQETFLLVSVPMATLLLAGAIITTGATLTSASLSLLAAVSVLLFTAGLASRLTGLQPNSRLFDVKIFTEYLVLNSIVTLPLLGFSILFRPGLEALFATASVAPGAIGLYLLRGS